MSELDNAQELLSTTSKAGVVDSPAYYYGEGYPACDKASYLLRLGKTREAVASAHVALGRFDRSWVDVLAYTTLTLAKAHIHTGHVNDAAQTVSNAASLAAQNRTDRLVKEVRTVRALLRPWNDTHAVKNLDEQLVSLGLV